MCDSLLDVHSMRWQQLLLKSPFPRWRVVCFYFITSFYQTVWLLLKRNFRIKGIFKSLSSRTDKGFHPQGTPSQLKIHRFKFHDTMMFYYRNQKLPLRNLLCSWQTHYVTTLKCPSMPSPVKQTLQTGLSIPGWIKSRGGGRGGISLVTHKL